MRDNAFAGTFPIERPVPKVRPSSFVAYLPSDRATSRRRGTRYGGLAGVTIVGARISPAGGHKESARAIEGGKSLSLLLGDAGEEAWPVWCHDMDETWQARVLQVTDAFIGGQNGVPSRQRFKFSDFLRGWLPVP